MTTKTKPEPTRIEYLEETLATLQANAAAIESEAAILDAQAQSAEERAAAMLADFDRPAEGLAQDVQALKNTAAKFRDGAELLRGRAKAYRAVNQLDDLETEHRMLVDQETKRQSAEREIAAHAKFVAEWEIRAADLRARYLASEALTWRLNFLADNIAALSQKHGLPQPHRMTFLIADIDKEVRWQISRANNTAKKDEIMAFLPKLGA